MRDMKGTDAHPDPASGVTLTHPERLYWPEAGVTKQGLASYYNAVWDRIAPFITQRPLALVRCPDGVGHCFFQKHAWQGLSHHIHPVPDPHDPSGEPLLSITEFDGLIGLVQGGVLEIHPWGSSLAAIEQPDMMIMDFDPAEDVPWPKVIEAANEVRERLDQLGLASFVKTTGGKGLHVVSPLKPKADWDAVKTFAKSVADAMASDAPDRFVATLTKAKRKEKILVDYLRNGRGNTAVAPYSTRARPGATVSMPIGWDELGSLSGPAHFTVANTPARLAHLRTEPWADFWKAAKPLPPPKREQ